MKVTIVKSSFNLGSPATFLSLLTHQIWQLVRGPLTLICELTAESEGATKISNKTKNLKKNDSHLNTNIMTFIYSLKALHLVLKHKNLM